MLFRQIVGVMSAALMLHLNVAASDSACAKHAAGHDHAEHASEVGTMAGMHMTRATEMQTTLPSHAEHPSRPCETPIVPSCCQAMASCSSTYAANQVSADWLPIRADAFVRTAVKVPLSRVFAPDPPPPRA